MSPFHIIVRALPEEVASEPITLCGRTIDSLIVPAELQSLPLGVSFETTAKRLEAFPRMFFEPDGSFVWCSTAEIEMPNTWQVDGNLYDREGSLVYVDVKGNCKGTTLKDLLDTFRDEKKELMIEIVRDAIFVREHDFMKSLLD